MTQQAESGNTVSVHYVGTLDDGSEFDNSNTRDEAISFEVGGTQVISGFSEAVIGMNIGESKAFSLTPENAYGPINSDAFQDVPRTTFPEGFELVKGAFVRGMSPTGEPILAKVLDYSDTEVSLDMNHPLAGQNLNFEIKLITID
jgi:peptidylprolyl isomerase